MAKATYKVGSMEVSVGGPVPEVKPGERLVRRTASVCPVCYRLIPAIIVERDGKLYIRKVCPEHGETEELYRGARVDMYEKFMKFYITKKYLQKPIFDEGRPCPYNCGLCPLHLSHTGLMNIVVTNRCDLSCRYCFPRDEKAVFKLGDEILVATFEEMSQRLQELGYSYDHKVRIDGFEGEYIMPKELYVLTFDHGKARRTRVTKFLRRHHKGEVYMIKTKTGRRIRTTPEHKYFVFEDGKLVKKRADELKAGDKVVVLRRISEKTSKISATIDLIEAFKKLPEELKRSIYVRGIKDLDLTPLKAKYGDAVYRRKHSDSMPLSAFYELGASGEFRLGLDASKTEFSSKFEITPELAKLVGYFVADGHYAGNKLVITAKHEDVIDDIKNILRKLGIPYSIVQAEGKAPQIFIGSKLLTIIFKHVLEIPAGAENKRLPKNFLEYPEDVRRAMLIGLLNGDGYVTAGYSKAASGSALVKLKHLSIGYASISRALIHDLLYLLASFGIFARVYSAKSGKRTIYKLYIAGEELEKLLALVGEELREGHKRHLKGITKRKPVKLQRIGDFYVDEIAEISTYEYDGFVYDLEVEHKMHAFVAGEGLLVSNCFFYAERAGFVYEPTIEQIREMIRTAHKQGLRAKAIQLTGGEPTMRDDLVDIVRAVREEGITHVQLNSHIIRLAYDAELTRRLREAGVNTVYMSFDGVTPNVNTKNHREVPYFFENARKAKMTSIVLVPTVIRGRNTDQLGAIIEFAARNMDIVRSVNFQPVSLVGQMKRHERERYRITIPEVIKLIEEQTNGQIPVEARYPVPAAAVISDFIAALSGEPQPAFTSHPVCGAGTYVYVERKGDEIKYIPITHFVDVDGLLERMKEVTEDLMTGRKSKSRFLVKGLYELEKFIDKRKQPKGIDLVRMLYQIVVRHDYSTLGEFHYRFLFLGMMHFQDPYNYDVDRVRRCVIHYGTPDGRVIPFCAFNVFPELYRDYIQKEFSIPLEEREKKHGKTKKYVRTQEMIKKLESGEPYIKHYKPFMHLRKKRRSLFK